jgi:hypothetical protein
MIEILKQQWETNSFEVFLSASENGTSPFSMTSYDHRKGMQLVKITSEKKESPGFGRRLTKDEKPRWRHMYAGFVRAGMMLPQARRKASGIIRGLTTQEARGHKEELGIITESLKKVLPETYNPEQLFAMQRYMEEQIQFYLKWFFESAKIDEIYVDYDSMSHENRQFEWKLFNEDGELRYWLVYEKGQIIKQQMWESFSMLDFKINIRELSIWE